MAQRRVENYRHYWIHSEAQNSTQNSTLTATANEHWCHFCQTFKWIVNVVWVKKEDVKENPGTYKTVTVHVACCSECHKQSPLFCQPQHCPFTNTKRPEAAQICTACCIQLVQGTQQLLTF